MFKRINTYLIENHPNVWHLRLPFLILTGLIFHVFAFLYGYTYLNERVLAETSYYRFITKSNFILIQVVLLLIVFFIWGLQFYKNSVLKHYYIAGRFYGIKLFSLLIVLLFWNISSFVTFDYGIQLKKNQLAQKYNFDELIKEKEFLNPLLLVSEDSYSLENNPYLTSNRIRYVNTNNTDYNGIYYCTKENYLKRNNDFTKNCITKTNEIDSNFYSRVENSLVVFYQLEDLQVKKDCKVNVINKFLKLDGYHWSELRNHPDYSKELDQLLKEQKYENLVKRMTAFKQKLAVIYPYTNFDPQINLNYILHKEGRNLENIVSDYNNRDIHSIMNINDIDSSFYSTKEFMESAMNSFYFDQYSWETTTDNLSRTSDYYMAFLITFIFSSALAYFLLQFQVINFINFAITVPIAGVMLVMGILFSAFLYDKMGEYTFMVYLLALLGGLIIVYRVNTRLKERANEVFMLLFASLIPITVMVVYGVIGSKIYIEKVFDDPCTDTFSSYEYFNAPSFYELHFLALGILSCIGFLLLVKKLKSKPE